MIDVIHITGVFDSSQSQKINTEINVRLNAGQHDIAIDLSDVMFMDSSGLGALISALKMVRAAEGTISLCGLSAEVAMLLELADVEQFFEIFKTVDEWAALQQRSVSRSA